MHKLLLYLKEVFLLMLGNKGRFILMIIGITVGIFVFSLGNIVLDSYYYSKMSEIDVMPENSFFFQIDESNDNITKEVFFKSDITPVVVKQSMISNIIYEQYDDNSGCIVSARMTGLSESSDTAVVYSSTYGSNLINLTLVDGRLLSNSEIKNNEKVCIIDEHTESLLFEEKEAVGKYIYFNKYNGGVSSDSDIDVPIIAYKIVGVVKDSFYARKSAEISASQSNNMNYQYEYVDIFCPYDYDTYINCNSTANNLYSYLWNCQDEESKADTLNEIKPSVEKLQNEGILTELIDKQLKYERLVEQLKPVRHGIKIIIIGLFLISGLSFMSVLFFSMKERAEEIGIKKAFGASWVDILFQFMIENIFISVIAFIIASIFSYLAAKYTQSYIKSSFSSDYTLVITKYAFLKSLICSMIIGVVFTIIPSIRYSLTSVVKSIRIDS